MKKVVSAALVQGRAFTTEGRNYAYFANCPTTTSREGASMRCSGLI